MNFTNSVKKLLFFPAAGLGVLVLLLAAANRQGPAQVDMGENRRVVRAIIAPETEVVPRALGYGTVEPAQEWQAVAEVSGRIVEVHPDLEKGAILDAGEVLFRIDPEEYGLAETRGNADVANIRAQLAGLDQQEENLRRLLAVERENLALAQAEFERKRSLAESGTIAQSELDAESQTVLAQRNSVQNYQSELDLIPAQREQLEAQLASAEAGLAGATLDLERTTVVAPFACRISEVSAELMEYASMGQVLAKASGVGVMEVEAQVPLAAFSRLLSLDNDRGGDGGGGTEPPAAISMDALRQALGISAQVRFSQGGEDAVWDARFSRISDEVDPATRTIGVFVTVDNAAPGSGAGDRPPLIRNMYCAVELSGPSKNSAVVVPRSAVHEGVVYVASDENRLEIRQVQTGLVQGDLVTLVSGVEPGERVVVTDVVPAIEGQLLDVVMDDQALGTLLADAAGETPIR